MHAGQPVVVVVGDASKKGQAMQAEAVAGYFMAPHLFPELLLVLEFPQERTKISADLGLCL